jgi:hypothetical protein
VGKGQTREKSGLNRAALRMTEQTYIPLDGKPFVF